MKKNSNTFTEEFIMNLIHVLEEPSKDMQFGTRRVSVLVPHFC